MRTLAALAVAIAALLAPSAALADGSITASCTTGGSTGACSTGWYRGDVTLSFSLSGVHNAQNCGDETVTADTTGASFRCTALDSANNVIGVDVTIKRDTTPPTAAAITAARAPDSGGWYNHAVAIGVTGSDGTSGIASCTSLTYSGPDSGSASVTGRCTDNAGNVSNGVTLNLQYDGTAPSVTPAPARAADANGWYNHPLDIAFQGADAASGLGSCTTASYSGPDNASATVTGSCTDKAGNTASASFGLRYDATPPAVTGARPARVPDLNGWYNHAVAVTFAGADATSGVAACDVVRYEKPNSADAKAIGRCQDAAGNVSAPAAFGFKYDDAPPKLTALSALPASSEVDLRWAASADVTAVKITRAQRGTKKPITVYAGRRITTFVDRKVRNGDRYTYLVMALDRAGNESVGKEVVTPAAILLAPRQTAHVRGGTTLRWRPVPRASYYNVQLWLHGHKVLTVWPSGPSLPLSRLAPGSYTWFVWPGFGDASKHRYGNLLGRSTFVVTR